MEHCIADIRYCEKLLDSLYDIGSMENDGVIRLGYAEQENRMHVVLTKLGRELQCQVEENEVGDIYVTNSQDSGYYLIGLYLDSIIEGGRYDGVAGIIAGLMAMKWVKEEGMKVPIRVGALRCGGSSNFGCCTIGSGLITREIYKQDIGGLVSKEGKTLEATFCRRKLNLHPAKITEICQYLELHIEQGKVLEESGTTVGIVQTIAGPGRFKMYLRGMTEHSGATPMCVRNDVMCVAAEIILELERIDSKEAAYQSVATVRVMNNHLNVLNVIPGEAELGVDIRGIESASLDRIEKSMQEVARRICEKRGIGYLEGKTSDILPVDMSSEVQTGLEQATRCLGIGSRKIISGTGHDATSLAGICDTGMVFIPCMKGVSYNRVEFASIFHTCDGTRVICEHLKGEAA